MLSLVLHLFYFLLRMENSFEDFVKELEEKDQPTCNLENPEDCEACGS